MHLGIVSHQTVDRIKRHEALDSTRALVLRPSSCAESDLQQRLLAKRKILDQFRVYVLPCAGEPANPIGREGQGSNPASHWSQNERHFSRHHNDTARLAPVCTRSEMKMISFGWMATQPQKRCQEPVILTNKPPTVKRTKINSVRLGFKVPQPVDLNVAKTMRPAVPMTVGQNTRRGRQKQPIGIETLCTLPDKTRIYFLRRSSTRSQLSGPTMSLKNQHQPNQITTQEMGLSA
jgi:hypothetical protein